MRYLIYILKLTGKKKRFYIGMTSNLERRLSEHTKGGVKSTKSTSPRMLYKEAFDSRSEASKREKWLKSGVGREWIKKRF